MKQTNQPEQPRNERVTFLAATHGGVEVQDGGDTVILGVSVCTPGEALGHGYFLDSDFISEVAKQGNEKKIGVKARFGHPAMCSDALGTFVGRFKNFRVEDGKAVADMHLADSAKKAPSGDLHEYIQTLAKEDPEAFGTSIVFQMGRPYRRDSEGRKAFQHIRYSDYGYDVWYEYEDGKRANDDDLSEELFAACDKLMACDFVDSPAANPDGLFTESAFSETSIAGKVAAFLDMHPDVVDALAKNPEILQVLKQHGNKVDAFLTAYHGVSMKDESKPEDQTPATEVPPVETAPDTPEEPAPEQPALSVEQYRDMVTKFGQEIADRVVSEKGGESEAIRYHNDALKAEVTKLQDALTAANDKCKELQGKLDALEEDGVTFQGEKPKPGEGLSGLDKAIAVRKAKKQAK